MLILEVCLLYFPHKYLEVPKLFQKWLMSQKLNVFGVVVRLMGRAAFVDLLHVLRLVRIDAFQDAQAAVQSTQQLISYRAHSKCSEHHAITGVAKVPQLQVYSTRQSARQLHTLYMLHFTARLVRDWHSKGLSHVFIVTCTNYTSCKPKRQTARKLMQK